MTTIRDILNLDQWPDLVAGPNGYVAKRRPDIAPFAYELKVNKPVDDSTLQKMLEFAAGADPELTTELFSLCNGVRVGATKFGVYGVIGAIDRSSSDSGYHPPLDINIPNIYGRPETWPENCLIVGFSYESTRGKIDQKMIHAITSDGRIIVAEEGDFLAVDREYRSVAEWLSSEVNRSLDNVLRF